MNGLVEKVCDGYDRHNIIVDILFPNFSIKIVILLVDKHRRFGDWYPKQGQTTVSMATHGGCAGEVTMAVFADTIRKILL